MTQLDSITATTFFEERLKKGLKEATKTFTSTAVSKMTPSRRGNTPGERGITMYMSYCRFEGTREELRACLGVIDEHVNGEGESAVSEKEIRCCKSMIEEFVGWLNDMGLLDCDGELDRGALAEVMDSLRMDKGVLIDQMEYMKGAVEE